MKKKTLKVVELFAGVGGFRLGLEKSPYQVIWSNQWEPSTKRQHASEVYEARFGSDNHSREDINEVVNRNVEEIPDHDLLCGGFPCQDYSVATTLHNSQGLKGKKGVLWWAIHKILEAKKNKPSYLFLENVDRLLNSPSQQRGRDFAVMLQSLHQLGYAVEWRVINAAAYGMPQRRRRIFFIGYHKRTAMYQRLHKTAAMQWLTQEGVMAKAFPVLPTTQNHTFDLEGDLVSITQEFNQGGKLSPFQNTGFMLNGHVCTTKTEPNYTGDKKVLGDVLEKEAIDPTFYIQDNPLKNPKTIVTKAGERKTIATSAQMWSYLKGAKKEKRKTQDGFEYHYAEGGMVYPDALDNASRTIITGEGGAAPSRFKHVVDTPKGFRRLTPVELERLNMFPDNHTQINGITDSKRAFFMGNALVVGVVEKIAQELYNQIHV